MSEATTDERRQYDTAHPERFAETFGLGEAHRFVAENGTATPRLAVIDTVIPDVAGDDTGPEELDVVARKVFGNARDGSHGTRSAAAAAASWENDVGVNGVASCEILAAGIRPTGERAAEAVRWATDNGADIISMSFGVSDSEAFRSALTDAKDDGVVLFGAGGNTDGPQENIPFPLPHRHPDVISVGATDSYGDRASFPTDPRRYEIAPNWGSTYPTDVSAWGVHVPAVRSDDADGSDDTPYWWEPYYHHGTSAACPVVAGVAALTLRVAPNLSPAEVRAVLSETGTELDTDHPIGPRVHAARAVKAAARRR